MVLNYGNGGGAAFTSTPRLFFREEDLYVDFGGERVRVTGEMVGMRRTVMEFGGLADQAVRPAAAATPYAR